jgi:hypothetical protein
MLEYRGLDFAALFVGGCGGKDSDEPQACRV